MAQKSSVGEMGIISNLRVGETGVGKMGVSKMAVGKMGVGEMGIPHKKYAMLSCDTASHIFPFIQFLLSLPAPVAQMVKCPLRGTGGHVFDPGLRHTKVVKNVTCCSSLGTQTYWVELGLVDPVSG